MPSFYIDFNAYQKREDDYKSSSGDVKKILEKFNNENVEALVLDLRNNGGGALMEANKIIGLFVASGPTVQVKHKAGYIQPYGASRAKQIWEKPLVVKRGELLENVKKVGWGKLPSELLCRILGFLDPYPDRFQAAGVEGEERAQLWAKGNPGHNARI